MHIAVCMDVAPDRKQLERLLGRSADKRLLEDPTVPFYVQSYGNKAALFARPLMYDLFFIDILHDTMDSVQIIHQLRLMGVTAPICYCPSKEDLSDRIDEIAKVKILKQPIKVEELDSILDAAVTELKAQVPTLDVRSTTDTIRITEEQLMYVERKGAVILIHLCDGTCVESAEAINVFYERARATFSDVYLLATGIVASKKAIKSTGFGSVIMMDDRKIHVGHKVAGMIQKILEDKSQN